MRKRKIATIYYGILAFAYLVLEITLPANKIVLHEYHLSVLQYHILLFILAIPLVALWFAAFFGYARLQAYADSVAKTNEGNAFQRLATGLLWLAWGLPIPSIVSLILNSIANGHSGFHSTAIIVVNYLSLLVPLIAFSVLSSGTLKLLNDIKLRLSILSAKTVVTIFVLFGILYCFLTFRHLVSHSLTSTNNPYYLPVWVVILTISLPYLYAWFTGLLAAYELLVFGKRAPGLLYRRALQILAAGMVGVIASLIALQYVDSIVPRTGHLSLDWALATTYIIRLISVGGYILIGTGANKLKKIEEV